jgi:hypothetical protein
MTDDKTQKELRAIREEAHQRAKDEKEERRREAEYRASQDRGGDGTRASRRAHEATKKFR